MENPTLIYLAVIITIGVAAFIVYLFLIAKKEDTIVPNVLNPTNAAIQLQAYERLVLLTDRIALPNLIARINEPMLPAKAMQALLIQSIKSEVEHNVTQQLYVSKEVWEAVQNLKEQNILIIHQVANYLPETATGLDLQKSIMQMLAQNSNASLHSIVAQALSYEAKKLMA